MVRECCPREPATDAYSSRRPRHLHACTCVRLTGRNMIDQVGAHHIKVSILSQAILFSQMEPDDGKSKPRIHTEERYILVLRGVCAKLQEAGSKHTFPDLVTGDPGPCSGSSG